jgi:hypothetical protein
MGLRARSASVAALLAAAALGAAAVPALLSSAGGASTAPRCTTGKLVVWLLTPRGGAAAGSTYHKVALTNLSGHACALLGYPGVSAVNLAGHQLGRAASRDPAVAPHVVTLGNGATAVAVLQVVDAFNFSNSACHRVTAAGLRVYPPGARAAKVVPFPFTACSRAGPVYLSVRAVQKM